MFSGENAFIRIAAGAMSVVLACTALAQAPAGASGRPVVYPSNNQSDAQQSKDKSECYTWATQQTGYDPIQALQQQQALTAQATQPPPPSAANGHQPAKGAVVGAAGGAAIGAVAGDAGKGAAIGAVTGLVAGGIRRRQQVNAQHQAEQQVAAAQSQANAVAAEKLDNYKRSFGACMQGRGYVVK